MMPKKPSFMARFQSYLKKAGATRVNLVDVLKIRFSKELNSLVIYCHTNPKNGRGDGKMVTYLYNLKTKKFCFHSGPPLRDYKIFLMTEDGWRGIEDIYKIKITPKAMYFHYCYIADDMCGSHSWFDQKVRIATTKNGVRVTELNDNYKF